MVFRTCFFAGLTALLAGCATPNGRITGNQQAFNSYPPAVRQQILNGQIAIGFTPEQVRMAIGEPSLRKRVTTGGGTAEVWEYRSLRPPGVGGVVSASARGGPNAVIYSGVHTHRTDLNTRVAFDAAGGTVSRIETYD